MTIIPSSRRLMPGEENFGDILSHFRLLLIRMQNLTPRPCQTLRLSSKKLRVNPEPSGSAQAEVGAEGLTTKGPMIIYMIQKITEGRFVSMKVRPLHDRLIIQTMKEEEVTKGGIIIPDTAKEKPVEGKVIAVGAGRVGKNGTKMPLEIKKGDRVLYAKYGGTEIKIDGEDYLMMKEDDILAIIE